MFQNRSIRWQRLIDWIVFGLRDAVFPKGISKKDGMLTNIPLYLAGKTDVLMELI